MSWWGSFRNEVWISLLFSLIVCLPLIIFQKWEFANEAWAWNYCFSSRLCLNAATGHGKILVYMLSDIFSPILTTHTLSVSLTTFSSVIMKCIISQWIMVDPIYLKMVSKLNQLTRRSSKCGCYWKTASSSFRLSTCCNELGYIQFEPVLDRMGNICSSFASFTALICLCPTLLFAQLLAML